MARVDSARSARRAVRWKRETPRDEKTRAVNYRGWHMRLVSGQNRRSVVERSLRTVLQRTSAGSRERTPLFANSLRRCPVFSSQPTRPLFLAGCHPIIIETSPSKPALAIAQRHDEARDQRKKPSAVRSRFSESIPTTRFDIDRPQSPARSRWRSECRRTSVCVSLLAISRESPQTRPPIHPIAQTTKLDFPSIGIDRLFDISAPGPYLASRAVSQGAKKAVRPCLCPTSPLPSSPIVVFRQRS